MPIDTLHDAEVALVRAVERGEPFDIARPRAPSDVEQTLEIRAEALIRMVRGQALPMPNSSPRTIVFTNAGIQLRGARIAGVLDLEDSSGPLATSLPRLSMEDCWFDCPIRLARSHLESLSFRDSRFTKLDASNRGID